MKTVTLAGVKIGWFPTNTGSAMRNNNRVERIHGEHSTHLYEHAKTSTADAHVSVLQYLLFIQRDITCKIKQRIFFLQLTQHPYHNIYL